MHTGSVTGVTETLTPMININENERENWNENIFVFFFPSRLTKWFQAL